MPRLIRLIATHLRRLWRPAMTVAVVLTSWTRCIEWKQPMAAEASGIATYVAGVQTLTGDAIAVLKPGAPPPATGTGGPIVTATVPQLVLLGGTIQLTATSTSLFSNVAVVVPGQSDYWLLTLPAPTTSAQILVVFSQAIPQDIFDVRIGGSNGTAFGVFQQSSVSVISVGTGDVQINVTWDSPADVDLHVVDPSGNEIYWANRSSSTGGQLDLDSNAACGSDGPRAENVFWSSGLIAPHGAYIVRVDHWSNCRAAVTHYVVTVNARGKPPQVFSGAFTGTGDQGALGAGRNITNFNY